MLAQMRYLYILFFTIFCCAILQGQASNCVQGERYDAMTMVCVPCQEGFVQPLLGQTECLACPAGQVMPFTGGEACISCPIGTVQPLSGQSECIACAVGSSSSIEGGVACEQCPIGSYQPQSGQASCIPCDPGFTTLAEGSISSNDCIAIATPSIPTLGEWGIFIMAISLITMGLIYLKQREFKWS